MKTVHLTPDEVKMIQEDISTTLKYYDSQLTGGAEYKCEWTPRQREEAINNVRTAESILKKLKVEP